MYCISAVYFKDSVKATEILNERDPRTQKSLARGVANFDETEWNKVSQDVVKQGSLEKVVSHFCIFIVFFCFSSCWLPLEDIYLLPSLWKLCFCLCVFVCQQDNSKGCQRILVKCFELVGCVTSKSLVDLVVIQITMQILDFFEGIFTHVGYGQFCDF